VKAIGYRIKLLEVRLMPEAQTGEPGLAEILWERRRSRLKREGVPAEQWPPRPAPGGGPLNPLAVAHTLAEAARQRRQRCRV